MFCHIFGWLSSMRFTNMRSTSMASNFLLSLGVCTYYAFPLKGNRGKINVRNNCPFTLYLEESQVTSISRQ